MTDTTTRVELTIPDTAAESYFVCGCSETSCIRAGYQPDAIPIIVAAELRRLADEYEGFERIIVDVLRDRADELDPQP